MPVRSPAKCEVRAVIMFLLAEGKMPTEICVQIKTDCVMSLMKEKRIFMTNMKKDQWKTFI